MLLQIHMRNRDDVTERKLLDQREVENYDDLDDWVIELREKHDDEMPEGWIYECVEDTSEHFIKNEEDDAESTDKSD